MDTLFTVIIPLYNKEMYIEKTLKSVIEQTYKKIEIIVIDDMSTDNSYYHVLKIRENMNLKTIVLGVYQNERNRGVGHTRNRGIELAKGQYVLFLDADDEISDKNLFLNLNVLINKYKSEYIVLTRNYYDEFLKPNPKKLSKGNLLLLEDGFSIIKNNQSFVIESNFPFGGSASALIATKFIEKNRFDKNEPLFEDWLFFMRIFLNNKDNYYYATETIFINYDERSTFKKSNNKIELTQIPKLYWFLNENKDNMMLRRKFFWIWLKGDISSNLNSIYIKKILGSYKKLLRENFILSKYSMYSLLMIFLYSYIIRNGKLR
ncbi:glycosyltransferase family 2 protein [Paenibacillus odorifer]|uniref:glycosyltransferase family 2 protein n=1 Tax=Paenibacillus odorifer TaxID=189426 RepID=UPI000BA0FD46|nr:glycosyltransferase family 2 protein [Paenibacillus odorifer]OZQ71156.1 hypothetical protein CA596_22900 [Paenibacillus odorifer]